MMKKIITLFFLLVNIAFLQAQNRTKHFISDATYRAQVEKAFEQLKPLANGRAAQLFDVFSNKLSLEEEEALKFLYAYMPLSDLADYDGKFFLQQVRMSLLARETFAWGKTIPEDIFRHFVLPYRINNENLDTARVVFYKELLELVKGKSMADAALEVNHWCHEKVTYKGSDGRTSAPLSTVKNATGRCGEESTFTVTALRAVGIPARQVYTPRWAHSDDNHAWVEVWIDGVWHFMGACEPEADLDIAWFSAPVLRAMLCNTTVYGNYQGPEEQLKSGENFTQINLISNYAPAKHLYVKTVDAAHNPIADATVEFQLYNYAEFYPLAKKTTDKNGLTSLQTGLGDLMIWASANGRFGYDKVSVDKTDTLTVVVNQLPKDGFSQELTFVPPVQRQPKSPSDKGKEENDMRLKKEDLIRQKYESTFIDSLKSVMIAQQAGVSADSTWMFLKMSRGNWATIARYIMEAAKLNRKDMFPLLASISEKDLHDVTEATLLDHLQNTTELVVRQEKMPRSIYNEFVLNPRISNEMLTPYKGEFLKRFSRDFAAKIQGLPALLIPYINENITVSATGNYSRNPLTPIGTNELKQADAASRDIYFVAVLRSFGVPAQIDPASKAVKYFKNGQWWEAAFDNLEKRNTPQGTLVVSVPKLLDFTPGYYTHFTIEKYEDGMYRSLDYEESDVFKTFPAKVTVDTGHYMVVTGVREKDGSVNTRLTFFRLKEDEDKPLTLQFITSEQTPKALGTVDSKAQFQTLSTKAATSLKDASNNKGMILAWIDPDREPTKHTLLDMQQLKDQFEQWDGAILLLIPADKSATSAVAKSFEHLPKQCIWGMDTDKLLQQVSAALHQNFGSNYPVVLCVDAAGNILDYSSGYKIGRGEQLVKMLKYLK